MGRTTAHHNIVHNNRTIDLAMGQSKSGVQEPSLSIDRCYNISLDSAFKQGFSSVWTTQQGGLTAEKQKGRHIFRLARLLI